MESRYERSGGRKNAENAEKEAGAKVGEGGQEKEDFQEGDQSSHWRYPVRLANQPASQ